MIRARLGVEVAITYVSVLRAHRTSDVRGILRDLRDVPLARVGAPPAIPRATYSQLARATQRVLAVMPTDARCLNQSLVLSALLARRGIASRVVVAVASPARSFTAHAWVEVDGRALLPPSRDGESRLVEL
ncbi:MAG TPA: lasso peptide biosynthesis B2 protein [Solirubrobacteraceae bacterium]|jgi:hypothetical protein|nr:lasso peptide biosynthesis B2 protein [Solirubrobacteraceae bacterium]